MSIEIGTSNGIELGEAEKPEEIVNPPHKKVSAKN